MPLTFFSLFLQLAVMQKMHMVTMDIKSAYLNATLPPDADWILTSPKYVISTHYKNIASATHYMAYLTPADYSTSTTKPHFSLKATACLLSMTASSFAPPHHLQ